MAAEGTSSENLRDSDVIIIDSQMFRTSDCQRNNEADISITESRWAAGEQKSEVSIWEIHRKNPKKILLKFEEHAVPTY